jgi:hypothetical protein
MLKQSMRDRGAATALSQSQKFKTLARAALAIGSSIVVATNQAARAQEIARTPTTSAPTVTISGRHFLSGGHEFRVRGVNYFPAYFPAIIPNSWLRAGLYRRDVVEEDLTTLQKLHVNFVSIQGPSSDVTPTALDCANLREFLDRARAHGIFVNLYIGSGSVVPISHPERLATIPGACGLAGNSTIFAYDIAWEPRFGGAAARVPLRSRWDKWLNDRYWGLFEADRAFGGSHTLPSDEELCADRPSVKVAAFRRFMDDLLSENYREVRSLIRSVDATHLISARSGYGGNGSRLICDQAPVDLRAAAKHLDFISPEGYALPLTDRVGLLYRGGFTVSYADVGKPVIWAEYGVNVDGSCPVCNEEVQAHFFADMAEMIQRSGSNGGVAWWYVGVRSQSVADSERSDFGIVHDHLKSPTSIDAYGESMRDGWLAMCVKPPTSLRLVSSADSVHGVAATCPDGSKSLGSFMAATALRESAIRASVSGHDVGSGWLTLCGADNTAMLVVTRDDNTGEDFTCPAGYGTAGSFKPSVDGTGADASAADALGRSIRSGWLTLCSQRNNAFLKRIRSNTSGREFNCPDGLKSAGAFLPDVGPVLRQAAMQVALTDSGLSGDGRAYTTWITVDRDEAAGDWKMYDDGVRAYANSSIHGERVGAHTACFGATSREVMKCVGNTPFNGKCPAKCLNSEWQSVQVKDSAGVWQTLSDEATVIVTAGEPVRARLVAGNTGDATWLTVPSVGGIRGAVFFACNENVGDVGCRQRIAADAHRFADTASGEFNISNGISSKAHVVFQMVAEHVAWFGERRSVWLTPK